MFGFEVVVVGVFVVGFLLRVCGESFYSDFGLSGGY